MNAIASDALDPLSTRIVLVLSREQPSEQVLEMGRSNLQKCPKCSAYALATECPECGAKMKAAAPLKFSPEDRQGDRRRQRKGVESGEWVHSLPSIVELDGEEE